MFNSLKRAITTASVILVGAFASAQEVQVTPAQYVDILINEGQYAQARSFLGKVSNSELDRLIVEGKIAIAQKHFSRAVDIYQRLVDNFPNDISFRQTLANLQNADQRKFSARMQFQKLISLDPRPQADEAYAEQIEGIDSYRNFGINGNFSLYPSNNINGASYDGSVIEDFTLFGTVVLPDELRANKGWGLNAGLSAFAQARIADQSELVIRGEVGIFRSDYKSIGRSNAGISLNYRYKSAKTTVEFGPFYNRYWGDGIRIDIVDSAAVYVPVNENYEEVGVSVFAQHAFSEKLSGFIKLESADGQYDDQEEYGYKTYVNQSAKAGMSHALTGKQVLSWNLGYRTHDEKGSNGNWVWKDNYVGKSVGLSLRSQWGSSIGTTIGINYEGRKYQAIYPLTDVKRDDQSKLIYGSIQNNDWNYKGLVPVLNCSYSQNDSNVRDFRTKSGTCRVSLSKSF